MSEDTVRELLHRKSARQARIVRLIVIGKPETAQRLLDAEAQSDAPPRRDRFTRAVGGGRAA